MLGQPETESILDQRQEQTKKRDFLFFSNKQKDSSSREALAEAAAAWHVGDGSGDVDMLKANMLAEAKWRGGEGMKEAAVSE